MNLYFIILLSLVLFVFGQTAPASAERFLKQQGQFNKVLLHAVKMNMKIKRNRGRNCKGTDERDVRASNGEIIFENPISTSFGNSVSDIYIRKGTRVIEVETKAGMQFFEGISGSNFATQSANSLSLVESISDYKVILNPDKISSLSNADKLKVIDAWKNHSSEILNNEDILGKFTKYWGGIEIDDADELVDLLKSKDDWFNDIFKNNLK